MRTDLRTGECADDGWAMIGRILKRRRDSPRRFQFGELGLEASTTAEVAAKTARGSATAMAAWHQFWMRLIVDMGGESPGLMCDWR